MKILVALAALLLAAPASADLWSHGCVVTNLQCTVAGVPYDCCTGLGTGTCPSNDPVIGTNVIGSGSQNKFTLRALERICWWTDTTDGAGRNSPVFRATGDFRVCVNDDLGAAGAGTYNVNIIGCPDGGRPTTNPLNVCVNVINTVDNGCTTTATRINPGVYYIDNVTNCPGGAQCQVSIEGVDPQRQ
jgi:hypothetical protein